MNDNEMEQSEVLALKHELTTATAQLAGEVWAATLRAETAAEMKRRIKIQNLDAPMVAPPDKAPKDYETVFTFDLSRQWFGPPGSQN